MKDKTMARKLSSKVVSKKDAKRLDELTVDIVQKINILIMKAQGEQLIAITNILKDARESIAWWAAYDDYNESDVDRLIHHLTLDNGSHTALDFLANFTAIKDVLIRDELVEMIARFQSKSLLSAKAAPTAGA